MAVRVAISDRPGGLLSPLEVVWKLGASVVDVVNSRTGGQFGLEEVEVLLTVETRGPIHRQDILDALDASGFGVSLPATGSTAS